MQQIPLELILVPDNRLREDAAETPIAVLAESLQTFGQLCPIVVAPLGDGTYRLVAGERRLLAAHSLSWTHINAVTRETANEDELRCIEIIENIHREQFTWQEEVKAKKELHERMIALNLAAPPGVRVKGNWTLEHTAALCNQSKATLSRDITLCERLVDMPSLAQKPTKASASDFARRHTDFVVREMLAAEVQQQRAAEAGAPLANRYELYVGDATQMMQQHVADESVDLVLTDPPFGLGIEDSGTWQSWHSLIYSDSPGEYPTLMKNFLREAERVLRPGRHCFVMCGFDWVDALRLWAEQAGFAVPGAPGVWLRLGGIWRQHMDRLSSNYYNILFLAKPYPGAQHNRWQEFDGHIDAAFSMPRVSGHKRHPAEAPIELFRKYIKSSTVRNETVLDPFCGSGSCGVAALFEERNFIGIDMEQRWIDLTRLRLEEVQTIKPGASTKGE